MNSEQYARLYQHSLSHFMEQQRLPLAVPHPDRQGAWIQFSRDDMVVLEGSESHRITHQMGVRPGFLGRLQGPVMVTYTQDREGCRATGGLGGTWDAEYPGFPLDFDRLQADLDEGLALRDRLREADSPVLQAAATARFGTLERARTAVQAGLAAAAAAPHGPAGAVAVALALAQSSGESVAADVAPAVRKALADAPDEVFRALGDALEASPQKLPVLQAAADAATPVTRERLQEWAKGPAGEALVPAMLPLAAAADPSLQPLLGLDPVAQTLLVGQPSVPPSVSAMADLPGLDPKKRKALLEAAVAGTPPAALMVQAVRSFPSQSQAQAAQAVAAALAPHLPAAEGRNLRLAADLASVMTPGDYRSAGAVVEKATAALGPAGVLSAARDLLAALPKEDQARGLGVLLEEARARGEQQRAPEVFEVLDFLKDVDLRPHQFNSHAPAVEAVLQESARASAEPEGLRTATAALAKLPREFQSAAVLAGLKASRHSPQLQKAADLVVFLRPLAEYPHPGQFESVRATVTAALEAWRQGDGNIPPVSRMAEAASQKISAQGQPEVVQAVLAATAERTEPAWVQARPVLEDLARIPMRGQFDNRRTMLVHALQVLDGRPTASDESAAKSGLPAFPADTPAALRLAYEAAMKLSNETSGDLIGSAAASLEAHASTRAEAECAGVLQAWNGFGYTGQFESRNKTVRLALDALRSRGAFATAESPALTMLRAGAAAVGKTSRGPFVRGAMEALLSKQDEAAGKTALFLPQLPTSEEIAADLEGSLARFENLYRGLHAGSTAADVPAGSIDERDEEVVIGEIALKRR